MSASTSAICAGSTPQRSRTLASSYITRSPVRPSTDEHAHPRPHELQQVLVAADHDDLEVAWLQRLLDQRGQHVVGLEAGHLDHRRAQRLEQPPHVGQLAGEVVGHRGPRGLVLGEQASRNVGPGGSSVMPR